MTEKTLRRDSLKYIFVEDILKCDSIQVMTYYFCGGPTQYQYEQPSLPKRVTHPLPIHSAPQNAQQQKPNIYFDSLDIINIISRISMGHINTIYT
jgi:hypothetical protein